MKSTGIIRRVDDLGRVVIPKELRNTFEIKESDPLEIYVDGDLIILHKYHAGCIFCGSETDVKEIHGVKICRKCAEEMPGVFGGEEK